MPTIRLNPSSILTGERFPHASWVIRTESRSGARLPGSISGTLDSDGLGSVVLSPTPAGSLLWFKIAQLPAIPFRVGNDDTDLSILAAAESS